MCAPIMIFCFGLHHGTHFALTPSLFNWKFNTHVTIWMHDKFIYQHMPFHRFEPWFFGLRKMNVHHHGIHVLTQIGGEVYENTNGHVVWHIECCPLKSNYTQCIDLQKSINHECKSKIISSATTISILAHGWWNNFKDSP